MKRLSLPALHALFTSVTIGIFVLFLGFIGVVSLAYADFLTGNFRARAETELLTGFNVARFDALVQRLEKRRHLPDPDPQIPNPFGIPGDQR